MNGSGMVCLFKNRKAGCPEPHFALGTNMSSGFEIETELAKQLLAGKVKDGQTVTVDYDGDGKRLSFSTSSAPEQVGAAG